MSTPEGDVSAIQSGLIEPLPVYTRIEDEQSDPQRLLASRRLQAGVDGNFLDDLLKSHNLTQVKLPLPVHEFPDKPLKNSFDKVTAARRAIVRGFFSAITSEHDEDVALFLNNGLVTPNTTAQGGKTPLLAAVTTRNIRIVQELLSSGADPDGWGVERTDWDSMTEQRIAVKRTPLQLAASLGHLPIVKLLVEVYHCDDSLIAPDGQIALRLAAENGHREVTSYLPSRRGGGFLRWKHHHQKAIRRAKKALEKLYLFLKFFFWDIEKFFLWTAPKVLVVKPLVKGCKWCWGHRKEFGHWCHHQVKEIPTRMKKCGKLVWKGIKATPKATVDAGKAVWRFGTVTLPKWLKELTLWFWNFITQKIPAAIAIAARWLWRGLSSTGRAIWDVILKVLSLLHTVFEAIVTFFRNLSLKDIWNGLCSLLRTIFVQIPQTIWSWTLGFSQISRKFLKALLGCVGVAIWELINGLWFLAVFVPKKLWVVLKSLGDSFGKAWYELMVFVRPKA